MATKKMVDASLTPEKYLALLTQTFVGKGDPFRAEQQSAYMKHQFAYCGLGAPEWQALAREHFQTYGTFTGNALKDYLKLSFDQEYREVQYVAIEMMQRRLAEQNKSWIQVLEKCILFQSWWDTVDWIAKLAGMHFQRFPELQHPYALKWISSDNMWLQRTAIIHQLFYKADTDEKLLFDLILRVADSREFFIRKACGWALRQHAKTYPEHVRAFINQHQLSGLTVRETMKELNRGSTS